MTSTPRKRYACTMEDNLRLAQPHIHTAPVRMTTQTKWAAVLSPSPASRSWRANRPSSWSPPPPQPPPNNHSNCNHPPTSTWLHGRSHPAAKHPRSLRTRTAPAICYTWVPHCQPQHPWSHPRSPPCYPAPLRASTQCSCSDFPRAMCLSTSGSHHRNQHRAQPAPLPCPCPPPCQPVRARRVLACTTAFCVSGRSCSP